MQLFYHQDLDQSVSQFTFPEEESKHIVRVLRKNIGDILKVTNGQGYIFESEIISAEPKRCKAQVLEAVKQHPNRYHLHLAVAPTKANDRYEWFLEKATEIGVDEITPIICQQSERKVIKTDRMEKVILSAMKQSLRSYLPKLNTPILFTEFIKQQHNGLLFIAHCEDGEKSELKRRVAPDTDLTILIGPEGDFSKNEIELALERGFQPVSLGNSRLRTETAGLVACTTVNIINNS